jgi:hypothetical protein
VPKGHFKYTFYRPEGIAMNPTQAIKKIRSQGFVSYERTWSLGHSIAAGVPKQDPRSTISNFSHLLYLYPSGDHWHIIDFSHQPIDDIPCDTLDEAVEKAIESLRSKSQVPA